jgi:hypothetical protein
VIDLNAIYGRAKDRIHAGADRSWTELPSLEQLLEIREIAMMIASRFPAERSPYVGLGQSPTPYLRFLEALHPWSTTDLPMSCAGRFLHPETIPIEDRTLLNPMGRGWLHDEIIKARLFYHLSRHMNQAAMSGKTILVIDYCLSGNSLMGGMTAIREWLKDVGVYQPLEGFGLLDNRHNEPLTNPNDLVIHWHKLAGNMNHRLMSQEYDRWSRFGAWYNSEHGENPYWTVLRDAFNLAVQEELCYTESQEAA